MVLHFPVSVGNFKSLLPFTPNSCFPLHFSPCQRNLKGFMVIQNSVSVILTLSPSCFLASVALNLLSPMTSYWWKTNPLHFVRQRQPFQRVCVLPVSTGLRSSVRLHVRAAAVHLRSLCERQLFLPDPQLRGTGCARYANPGEKRLVGPTRDLHTFRRWG